MICNSAGWGSSPCAGSCHPKVGATRRLALNAYKRHFEAAKDI